MVHDVVNSPLTRHDRSRAVRRSQALTPRPRHYFLLLFSFHQVAVGDHAVSLATVLEQLLGVHPPVTFVVVKLTDHGRVGALALPVPLHPTLGLPYTVLRVLLGAVIGSTAAHGVDYAHGVELAGAVAADVHVDLVDRIRITLSRVAYDRAFERSVRKWGRRWRAREFSECRSDEHRTGQKSYRGFHDSSPMPVPPAIVCHLDHTLTLPASADTTHQTDQIFRVLSVPTDGTSVAKIKKRRVSGLILLNMLHRSFFVLSNKSFSSGGLSVTNKRAPQSNGLSDIERSF
jgi:hypothetical protein